MRFGRVRFGRGVLVRLGELAGDGVVGSAEAVRSAEVVGSAEAVRSDETKAGNGGGGKGDETKKGDGDGNADDDDETPTVVTRLWVRPVASLNAHSPRPPARRQVW